MNNLQLLDTVVVKETALALIVGRNIHDKSYLVRLIDVKSHGYSKIIRVKMADCIPATEAAWVLYTKQPLEVFEQILIKGYL